MRGHDNNGRGLWSGRLTQKAIETSTDTIPTPSVLPPLPEAKHLLGKYPDTNISWRWVYLSEPLYSGAL